MMIAALTSGRCYLLDEESRSMRLKPVKPLAVALALAFGGNASAFSFLPAQTAAITGEAAAVAIGDLTGDGRNDVVLVNTNNMPPAPTLNVFVFAQDASGSLLPPTSYVYRPSGQTNVASLVLADLNNDGRLDVVVGHNQGLSTLMTQANGSLGPASQIAGLRADVMRVTDVNLDGNADIVVVHASSGLTVFTGNGIGGFSGQSNQPSITQGGVDLEMADVNGDGREDAIVTSALSVGTQIAVHYHNGVGGLGAATPISLSGLQDVKGVAVGDINSDGRQDIVTTNGEFPPSRITPILQNASGQLAQGNAISSFSFPANASSADLDGDGDADLVVEHNDFDMLGAYLQTGGALTPETLYSLSSSATASGYSLDLGDINSDGCTDAVLGNATNGLVWLYGQGCAGIDDVPNAFSFVSLTGVPLNSLQQSAVTVIQGINTAVPISVANGEYRIDGGAYTTAAGVVSNGQSVQVRHTSANAYNTTTTTTLTVGGVNGTFSTTTANIDTTPNAFAFVDESGLATSIIVISQAITVAGINAPASISVVGGEYSINNGAFTSGSGTVQNGATVRVRLTTASTANTAQNATLTIGGVSDTFTATTGSGDSTPDPFALVNQTGVKKSQWVTSNAVTVSGINLTVNASVTGTNIRWSKNGGAWQTGIGTVSNGDQVRVQMKSSDFANTAVNGSLTIGNVSASWTLTTGNS